MTQRNPMGTWDGQIHCPLFPEMEKQITTQIHEVTSLSGFDTGVLWGD